MSFIKEKRDLFSNILIFLVIFSFFPTIHHPFHVVKLLFIGLFILLYLPYIQKIYKPFLVLYFIFLLYFIIYPTYNGLFFITNLLLFYFLFLIFSQKNFSTKIFTISTIFVGIYGILQFFHIDIPQWGGNWGLKRVFSSIGNPNLLGIYLVTYIIYSFSTIKKEPKKLLDYLGLTISIILLFMTFSKGAFLSLFSVFFIYLLKKKNLRKIAFVLLTIFIILSIIFIKDKYNSRYHIFHIDLKTIQQHPVGKGIATFPILYKKSMASYVKNMHLKSTAKIFVKRAHSELFQMGIELGFFGFFIYLFLYFFIGFYAIHRNYLVILPILIFSLYDFPFHDIVISFIFVFFLGKLFYKKIKLYSFHYFSYLFFIVFVLNTIQLIGEFQHNNPIYDHHMDFYTKAKILYKHNELKKAYNQLKKAEREEIYPEYINLMAKIIIKKGNIKEGIKLLKYSEILVPEDKITRKLLIYYDKIFNNWNDLELQLKKLLEYEKNDSNYYSYAVSCFHNNHFAKGIEALNHIQNYYETIIFAQLNFGNFEYVERFKNYNELLINKAILIKKGKMPPRWKKLDFTILSRKSYSIKNAFELFPHLILNQGDNLFNPTYYLSFYHNTNDLEKMKEKLLILYSYFYNYKILATPIYCLWNLKLSGWNHFTMNKIFKNINYNSLTDKQKNFFQFIFEPQNITYFVRFYNDLIKNKDLLSANNFALRYDQVFGNVLKTLKMTFIKNLYLCDYTIGEAFKYAIKNESPLNKNEKTLLQYAFNIASGKIKPSHPLKWYQHRKKMTLKGYFTYIILSKTVNPDKFLKINKIIIDKDKYPHLLYLMKERYKFKMQE